MLRIFDALSILAAVLSLDKKIYGFYFMTAGYSWMTPRNLSWMSQMKRAVDFNPRIAILEKQVNQTEKRKFKKRGK